MKNTLYSPKKIPDEPKPSGEQCSRARKVFLPLGRHYCTGADTTVQGQTLMCRGRHYCAGADNTVQGQTLLCRGRHYFAGADTTVQGREDPALLLAEDWAGNKSLLLAAIN